LANDPITFSFNPTEPNPELSPEQQREVMNLIYLLVAEGMSKGVEAADAIGLSPAYIDALHELALRRYQQQQFDSAAQLYQRLLQLKPLQLTFYKGLGACCLGLQRYDAAIKVYNVAVQFGALDAELHYYLGQAYYLNKAYEPAFDLMRFARVLDERDPASPGKIAAFATQMLERIKPLVTPEQAALMDLRPPADAV
jgi:tetratricopeptide (TPR) repeat protein